MDTERNTNPVQRINPKIREIETLGRKAAVGESAEIVLQIMDPILEERLGALLDQFRQCVPELGPLLDFRAKITEVWSMRKKIKTAAQEGKTAAESLRSALEQAQAAANRVARTGS